jgi:hypothetical protein
MSGVQDESHAGATSPEPEIIKLTDIQVKTTKSELQFSKYLRIS